MFLHKREPRSDTDVSPYASFGDVQERKSPQMFVHNLGIRKHAAFRPYERVGEHVVLNATRKKFRD